MPLAYAEWHNRLADKGFISSDRRGEDSALNGFRASARS